MRKTAWMSVTLALGVAFLGSACSREPAKVTVAPDKAEIVGKDPTITLKATVTDSKGKGIPEATLSWRSSNEKVAAVDPGGKVTGKTSGGATISATAGKVTGNARISVTFVETVAIKLPDEGLTGPPGTRIPLAARVDDEHRNEVKNAAVTFESSNPAVASVDKDGVVTLNTPGMVTLRALVGKVKGEVTQEVIIQVPRFLRLPNTAVFLRPGETSQLEFEVFDKKGQALKVYPLFTSSDPAVVTVSNSGLVTAVTPGAAQVSVAVGPESRPIHVTVK